MFRFIHGYWPKVWQAQVNAGLVGEQDGIRFCQSLLLPDAMKFNALAAVGGPLHQLLSQRKCPFYIDRLQGGCYIEAYPYDQALLAEYRALLGNNFWGFQMHEWMSNYRQDALDKLGELPREHWSEEEIAAFIYEKFPFPCLFLESATAEEMAEGGKPEELSTFYKNITDIYRKRMQVGELLPCDSAYLAYGFEISCGAKRLMPEVGAQSWDTRLQVCYARGMTRAPGRSFGIYYEPWGGNPFSACCYQKDGKNEWGIGESADFPFETHGPNGGSSRALQKRIFLYGLLSGAEFISEEWGICNTFCDWEDFVLSPYGQVKKEFLEFARKYTDIGDKLTPIAVVLPKDLMVLDNIYEDDLYCGFRVESEALAKIKQGIRAVFTESLPMVGRETRVLKNSDVPDAVDLLNDDDSVLDRYEYLVDLTCDEEFARKHPNICTIADVKPLLKKCLPCYVEGNAHWLVNARTSGGYYLTVFNHSGITRSVSEGEGVLPEAETTVTLSFAGAAAPVLLEGDGCLQYAEGAYRLTLPPGGWAFIQFGI